MDGTSLNMDALSEFLHIAFWVKFATNVLYMGIGLYMARGTVRKHFTSIEEKLERMAASMLQFGQTLTTLETNHSQRISKLEGTVNELKSVTKLKE